jgi:hypothetical protein
MSSNVRFPHRPRSALRRFLWRIDDESISVRRCHVVDDRYALQRVGAVAPPRPCNATSRNTGSEDRRQSGRQGGGQDCNATCINVCADNCADACTETYANTYTDTYADACTNTCTDTGANTSARARVNAHTNPRIRRSTRHHPGSGADRHRHAG